MSKHFVSEKAVLKAIAGKRSINAIVREVCGEMIGTGLYRDVYVLKLDPRYVVKIERDPSTATFANVTEWRNYINNREWKKFSKWLAPCELINETGQMMIQRRVSSAGKTKSDYPKKIPSLFSDLKYDNFGWIYGEQFVCCDYSWLKQVDFKLVKAKWWSL